MKDSQNKEFIVALREYKNLGFLPIAYHIARKPDKEFYSIVEPVTHYCINRSPEKFTASQKEIVRIIEEFSDNNLKNKFSKNKASTKDFFQTLDQDTIELKIRPYVERRMVRIFDILCEKNYRLFYKMDKYSNIYENDELHIQCDAAQVIFNFIRDDEGLKYFLSIRHQNREMSLNGKVGYIVCHSPCRMIIDDKLYYFNDIDGKKLLPFFEKKYIQIPGRAVKKYMQTFVLNAIRNYDVNPKGFEIKRLHVPKKIQVSLQEDYQGKYVLVPELFYGNKMFLPNNTTQKLVFFRHEGTKYWFELLFRDKQWEKQSLEKLKAAGLQQGSPAAFRLTDKNQKPEFEQMKIINWLNENKKKLEQAGIEVSQNLHKKRHFIDELKLDIKIKQARSDWFDLYAVVRFGDYEIPFIKLKNHILSDRREFTLPNGEIAILPDEWFSRYRNLMLHSEENQGQMSLKKHYFSLLKDKRVHGISQRYKDKFMALSNKQIQEHEIPEGISAKLRPYQKTGFSWMFSLQENNFGGCLADDMGLGKTLQTLCLLQKTRQERLSAQPKQTAAPPDNQPQLSLFAPQKSNLTAGTSLIVMPSSLVHNWKAEIKKFAPQMKIYLHTGSNRSQSPTNFARYDIVLSSYTIVRNDFQMLENFKFLYLILDESQYVKNPESKTYQAVSRLKAEKRLVLTGTPIENSLTDLWAQMNFLNKGLLGNFEFFKTEFVQPIERFADPERQNQLQLLIRPFILRRTKSQVAKDLPSLTEQTLFCEMSEKQRQIYETEKSSIRNELISKQDKKHLRQKTMDVLAALNRLRQLANHPKMLSPQSQTDSGKFDEITEKLQTLISEGHKVLVFSSFVKHLNLLALYIEQQGWEYAMLTGQTPTAKREEVIAEFQTQAQKRLFLISLKAGGVGLNLTAADYVFILDPWWNPAAEMQAINRAHRIGQDKKVFVYRFISKNSIEEKIEKLKSRKAALADTFVQNNNPLAVLNENEIMQLFD